MLTITPDTTVKALVVDDARRTRLFERLGIDYCCGGKRPLHEVCAERDLDPDTVVAMLEAYAPDARTDGTDWAQASLGVLIDHIEATHHAYLRDELPRLERLLKKVAAVHGAQVPWMVDVRDVFNGLQSELLDHLAKEEEVVFPLIRALEAGDELPATTTLADPIQLMEDEHEAAGAALAEMRTLTNGFTPPEGACGTFRAALSGLAELEADTHRHVHKENNILFKRARALV